MIAKLAATARKVYDIVCPEIPDYEAIEKRIYETKCITGKIERRNPNRRGN
jgi:hypothetical protein